MPPILSRLAVAGLATALVLASAADAFAIRNRYTNEQNQGFTALLFGGFEPLYDDEQPLYRPARRGFPFAPAGVPYRTPRAYGY